MLRINLNDSYNTGLPTQKKKTFLVSPSPLKCTLMRQCATEELTPHIWVQGPAWWMSPDGSDGVEAFHNTDREMQTWTFDVEERTIGWANERCEDVWCAGKKRKTSESASACVAVTSQVERRLTEMESFEAGGGEWRWVGRGEGEEGDPVRSGVDDCRRKGRGDGRYRHTRWGRGSGGGVKGLVRLAAKHNYSKAAVVGRQCFSRGKQLWQA